MSRIILGLQAVREAIRAHGNKMERVLVETTRTPSPTLDAVARHATDNGIPVERVDRGAMDKLSGGVRHQGVVAYAPNLHLYGIEDLELGPQSLLVALDELEDPQNFGAVLRSAVALGADAIVWPENHSAPLSPTTFRASAGAVEHARLVRVPSLPAAMADLAGSGVELIGLDASADTYLHEIDLRGPVALVLGAEGKGLRKGVKKLCTRLAKLPMNGPVASLNASVALAVSLYEVIRQRNAVSTPGA